MNGKYRKQKVRVMFAAALLLACIAWRPQPAEAAKKPKVEMWSVSVAGIESGKSFDFGNLVHVNIGDERWMASELKASYTSDNPEVIAVDAEGHAETKAPGSARVIVSYCGKKESRRVEVVPQGELSAGREQAIAKLEKAADKLDSKLPSGMTGKNGYAVLKAVNEYLDTLYEIPGLWDRIDGMEEPRGAVDGMDLIAPKASCFLKALCVLQRFENKYHPFLERGTLYYREGSLKITSANPEKVSLKFKKALTGNQILALYAHDLRSSMEEVYGTHRRKLSVKINKTDCKTRYKTEVVFEDTNWREKDYKGVVVFQKGKMTAEIKPVSVQKRVGIHIYKKKKNLKLPKGHTYTIWSVHWSWHSTPLKIKIR